MVQGLKSEIQVKGRCPICREPADMHYRPFCSKRCADIDLGRWLTGGYAIGGGDADADEDGDDTAAGRGQGEAREQGSSRKDEDV
jgi:endogenous inhibitor of DNA gyrase (YacG/DUF329 family)